MDSQAPTTPQEPTVGTGYLNVTFMSTSAADPSNYLKGVLSNFYDNFTPCCMQVYVFPVGMPILPIGLGGAKSSLYPSEKEVLVPPGMYLVFLGTKMMQIATDGEHNTEVYFYMVVAPTEKAKNQAIELTNTAMTTMTTMTM
jgi:hypothetical protein